MSATDTSIVREAKRKRKLYTTEHNITNTWYQLLLMYYQGNVHKKHTKTFLAFRVQPDKELSCTLTQ
jgi:hypothetical protein